MVTLTREEYAYLARIAEQSERYEGVCLKLTKIQ